MRDKRKRLRLMPKPCYPSLIADEIEPVYPMESKEEEEMSGWIDVPKIGLIKVWAIVRVGEADGDSVNKGYNVYLSNGHIFRVAECDMTRDAFINLVA